MPDGTSNLSPPKLPKPPRWATDPTDPRYQLRLRPTRPAGVVVIVTLNFALAAFLLLIFVLSFFQPTNMDATAYLLPIPALFAIIIGFGPWTLSPWARLMCITFYAFAAVLFVVTAFTHPFSSGDLLSVIVPVIIVVYLLQPSVRAPFEHHSILLEQQASADDEEPTTGN